MRRVPISERLARYLVPDPETGCINWVGSKRRGYGFVAKGAAHRIAYELAKGPIPTGLEIDHLCYNRACCNPDHLEAVTHTENVRRAAARSAALRGNTCRHGHPTTDENTYTDPRGRRHCRACFARRRQLAAQRRFEARGFGPRHASGERNGSAKLTPGEVLEIRSSALGLRDLAKTYSVRVAAIRNVRTRRTWKELSRPQPNTESPDQ